MTSHLNLSRFGFYGERLQVDLPWKFVLDAYLHSLIWPPVFLGTIIIVQGVASTMSLAIRWNAILIYTEGFTGSIIKIFY